MFSFDNDGVGLARLGSEIFLRAGLYSLDIVAAIKYLRETLGIAPERIAVAAVGTSCALVEKAIYETRLAPGVVYLSPNFAAHDNDLETAVSFHADRPAALSSAMRSSSFLRWSATSASALRRAVTSRAAANTPRTCPPASAYTDAL